ncbi:DUF222 domain-containing protein [Pseudokineococcus basanitobsidens]|uniref:DUF222 domain-containing protein n=1 Tax=Pseudokineococcus basanitobsidens TaxID=1926649 RepID=A0ABU8RM58_9ACTN
MSTDQVAGQTVGGEEPLVALASCLAAARSAATCLELWAVPTPQLRTVLEGLEGVVRVAQAVQVLVIGEVASRGDALVPSGLDPAARALLARSRAGDGRAELARALGVHPATAARRQATAAYVTGAGMPPRRVARTGGAGAGMGEGRVTGRALAEGRISAEAADVVAATVLDLPEHYGPEGRAAVERVLVEHAPEVPLTTLRHHAAGLLARAELCGDGPGTEGDDLLGRAEERAHRRRELYCSTDLHGTWHVRGRLAPEDGATLVAALGPLSAPEPSTASGPDLRTAPQRRADALVALASRALAAPPGTPAGLPTDGGARARVVVTTDLSVLTGAAAGAGLLPDDAPLSAGAVRRLACDAEIVPAVLGTRSEPLDLGRAAYTVTAAQRRALVLRDRGCAAPGCQALPDWCHAHHVVHWADGGPTDLANLVLVCGHDHRRVHGGQLDVHVVGDRPVVVRAGEPPPDEPPVPWRARLEDLVHELDHPRDDVGGPPLGDPGGGRRRDVRPRGGDVPGADARTGSPSTSPPGTEPPCTDPPGSDAPGTDPAGSDAPDDGPPRARTPGAGP